EYVEGQTLAARLETGPLPLDQALKVASGEICTGLAAIHEAGIVHRDIKPANLYVRDSDASLVLLDFGAARHTAGNSSKSLTSVLTPGYAPFEQYHARGSQGPWTDLYALGGVLYWLVTGQKPLEAPSRVKDDPMAPAVVAAAGRFSEHLLRAIDWALTVDEKQRPLTVCDFRAALTGEAAFEVPCQPVPIAVSATVAAPEPSAVASRSSRVGLAMAAVITIGGAAAYFAISSGKPAVPDVSIVTTGEKPAAPVERAGKSLAAAPNVAPSPKHKKVETTEKTTKIAAQHENPVRATDKSRAAAGATSALKTFEIVPKGESAEIMLDDRKIGRAPELREYRLPSGKHKIQITGSKAPYTYYYWVTLETGEKKNIWARFADNN
ncbi:MAG TPA: hypothetical protein DIC36_01115, partial [Gammaproteobacteria bacterium]|nr:hypothetical protein [Gammaproteobacteria bacterium]